MSLDNFIKIYSVILSALDESKQSVTKKSRDWADKNLVRILDIKFVEMVLGCMDIYRVIATASRNLFNVEQFPWEATRTLNDLI